MFSTGARLCVGRLAAVAAARCGPGPREMAPDHQFTKSRHSGSQRRVVALALVWMALVTLSVLQVGGQCGG